MTTAALTTSDHAADIKSVNFYGAEIPCIPSRGRLWVAIRPICADLGMDDKTQRDKLQSKAWATKGLIPSVSSDSSQRELFCIDLDSLPMWLATIDAGRVSASARPKLVRYQKECARVLRDAVFGQVGPATMVMTTTVPAPQPVAAMTTAPAASPMEQVLPELLAELRASREERSLTFKAIAGMVTMVGEMTRRPAPALPESAAVHVVPTVVEKEWVTTREALVIFGLSQTAMYTQLRKRGTMAEVRRKTVRSGKAGGPVLLWNLPDLRLALTGKKVAPAPVPAQVWTADVPVQQPLPNVVPIRPEMKVEQPKQQQAPGYQDGALRDAVKHTIQSFCVRTGQIDAESRHAIWTKVYNLFAAQMKYDPRREHDKKERAIGCVERRKDMATLLRIAQQVCGVPDEFVLGAEHRA